MIKKIYSLLKDHLDAQNSDKGNHSSLNLSDSVIKELDRLTMKVHKVPRQCIVEQKVDGKIRPIVKERIKKSIIHNGIDDNAIELLLLEKGDRTYELFDGNHRFAACCELFDDPKTRDRLRTIIEADDRGLIFPAKVIPLGTNKDTVRLFSLRSNLLRSMDKTTSWQDYLSVMPCYNEAEVNAKNFKTKVWMPQVGETSKNMFTRTRNRAKWLFRHNCCVDVWRMVAERKVIQRRFEELQKLKETYPAYIYMICVVAASKGDQRVQEIAESFNGVNEKDLLGAVRDWLKKGKVMQSQLAEPPGDKISSLELGVLK